MAKIAIDCDGVLADFTHGFYQGEVNRMWPGRIPQDWQPSGWEDSYDLSAAEVEQVWARIKATTNWWLFLQAYSDNVGALARWLNSHYRHDIWIVTSRVETLGATVAKQTAWWLDACGVRPHDNYLGVIPTPYASDKARLYKATGMEYSIDDKGDTVDQCDKIAGHHASLLARPWNQEFRPKRRVKTLGEFLEAIRE